MGTDSVSLPLGRFMWFYWNWVCLGLTGLDGSGSVKQTLCWLSGVWSLLKELWVKLCESWRWRSSEHQLVLENLQLWLRWPAGGAVSQRNNTWPGRRAAGVSVCEEQSWAVNKNLSDAEQTFPPSNQRTPYLNYMKMIFKHRQYLACILL